MTALPLGILVGLGRRGFDIAVAATRHGLGIQDLIAQASSDRGARQSN